MKLISAKFFKFPGAKLSPQGIALSRRQQALRNLLLLVFILLFASMNTSFANSASKRIPQPELCVDYFNHTYKVGGREFHVELECAPMATSEKNVSAVIGITAEQLAFLAEKAEASIAIDVFQNVIRAQNLKAGTVEHDSLVFESADAEIAHLAGTVVETNRLFLENILAASLALAAVKANARQIAADQRPGRFPETPAAKVSHGDPERAIADLEAGSGLAPEAAAMVVIEDMWGKHFNESVPFPGANRQPAILGDPVVAPE